MKCMLKCLGAKGTDVSKLRNASKIVCVGGWGLMGE